MTSDISHVLKGWDFDPHELNVRIITGENGALKLQMRIDLGLLQMEAEGRPDGQRPHDCESLLDYYERQAKEFGKDYRLCTEAVEELFREGWQYYHRYLCFFHIGDYEPVVRDTERNLRLYAFIRAHTTRKRDQWRFDQYRPYVVMMNARARAMMALAIRDKRTALQQIERGRQLVEDFLREYGKPINNDECFELEFLNRWHGELMQTQEDDGREPIELTQLRMELQRAIEHEDYEYAAVLRDQIKRSEMNELPRDF